MSQKHEHHHHKRGEWSSSLGFILAAAGSAVGLGNIWKFPGRAYKGGGGAFLLVYILIVVLIGSVAMLSEFAVGRNTKSNAVGAFNKLNPKWKIAGWLGIITGFIVSCYYIQVGGWVLNYVVAYITEPSAVFADPLNYFYGVLGANGFPFMGAIVYPAIFIGICMFVLFKGVSGGIEKFNKIAMPGLLFLLFVLLVRSVTMPGAIEGVKYLLHVDFSTLTPGTILSALGQAFYSLSIGLAIMVTYGSYLKKEENLVQNVGYICFFDTMVAIVAGFMIIPAVFATGVDPGMGGGFAFASLAGVFHQMSGGAFFGALFYLLLLFAALTSEISIVEGTIAFISEEFHLNRKKTIIVLCIVMFAIGVFYTLSLLYMPIKGVWFDLANGLQFPSFGDFLEFVTDRLFMPLGALLFCIFVGWIWKPENAIKEVEQDGAFPFKLAKLWSIMVKYVVPVAIFIVLVSGLVFGMAIS
ncbi:MAG: sodium-dependent transporter [Lachnospiraceae bacterium]|nr:sodium-dependent transporter [Lachnospiraceae bacterium]